jgi:hypothetical protein
MVCRAKSLRFFRQIGMQQAMRKQRLTPAIRAIPAAARAATVIQSGDGFQRRPRCRSQWSLTQACLAAWWRGEEQIFGRA